MTLQVGTLPHLRLYIVGSRNGLIMTVVEQLFEEIRKWTRTDDALRMQLEADLQIWLQKEQEQILQNMSSTLQKVKAIRDESGHWYVIPENLLPSFQIDEKDETMIDSGEFDDKWGKYRTGGDLNLVQLWAEL